MLSEVEVLEHVKTMRADGQRWENIASSLGMSSRKLWEWRKEINFDEPAREKVDTTEVTRLRRIGFNWAKVAEQMQLSCKSLENWRLRTGFVDCFKKISDEALTEKVVDMSYAMPSRGIKSMSALLKRDGIYKS